MKRLNVYSLPYSVLQESCAVDTPISARLQQLLSEFSELNRALINNQQQSETAQQQIKSLTEDNAHLKQKLAQLGKKYVKVRNFGHHDELTGLPNRNLLLDRLKQAMAQSIRQHKQVVLLFIDLDKFKNVNDRLGHAAGDKLLQQVAERLSACLRIGDTACRYGGDEFVIMLPEIDGNESTAAVIEKIRSHLATPYLLDELIVAVTASIGTTVYQSGEQNCNDLIKQADISMYFAKECKRLHATPFNTTM